MDEPEKLRRPVPPNKRDFAAIDLSAQTRLVFADPTQADLSQSITGEIEHPSIEEPRRDCKTSSSPGSTLLPTTQPIKSLRSENRQGGARFSGDGARFGEDGATNGAGGLAMIDDAESSKAPGARFLKTLTDNPFGRLLQTFLAAIGRFVLYVFPTLLDERTKYHLQALGFGRRYHADIFVGLKAAAIASVVWAFVQELCAHPHLMFGFPVLLFLLIVITWTIGNFFLACWVAELELKNLPGRSLPRRFRAVILTSLIGVFSLTLGLLFFGRSFAECLITSYVGLTGSKLTSLLWTGLWLESALQLLTKGPLVAMLTPWGSVQLLAVAFTGYAAGFVHWFYTRAGGRSRLLWLVALVAGCFVSVPIVSAFYNLRHSSLLTRKARICLVLMTFCILPVFMPGLLYRTLPFEIPGVVSQFGGVASVLTLTVSFIVFWLSLLTAAWKTGAVARITKCTDTRTVISTIAVDKVQIAKDITKRAPRTSIKGWFIPALISSIVLSCVVWVWQPVMRSYITINTSPPSVAAASNSAREPVVFAACNIEQGMIIPSEALELRYVRAVHKPGNSFESTDEVVGLEAKRGIKAGEYVAADSLQELSGENSTGGR